MDIKTWGAFTVAASALLATGCSTTSSDAGYAAVDAQVTDQDGVDNWEFVSAPSDGHRQLESLVGTWDVTVKIWGHPDDPPYEGHGTLTRAWVLGGRYLREELNGQSPLGELHGFGYMGYNNIDGRYEMTWMDDRSTAMSMETGRLNTQTNILTMIGTLRDPDSAVLLYKKTSLDISDPNRHRSDGWSVGLDGVPLKMFEAVLTRR